MGKKLIWCALTAALTFAGLASCYQQYVRGHEVTTLSEFCDYVSGVDLYEKHSVRALRFNCPAIRSDYESRFESDLVSLFQSEPKTVSSPAIQEAVSVHVNGRALFITYRGSRFEKRAMVQLITDDEPKSCWDNATRNLFDSVSGDFGFYEPTISLPPDPKEGPCSGK